MFFLYLNDLVYQKRDMEYSVKIFHMELTCLFEAYFLFFVLFGKKTWR